MLKLLKKNTFINYLLPVTGGLMGGVSISSFLWLIFMPISLSILWSGIGKKYSNFLWGFSFVLVSHHWLLYLHPLTWLGFTWISSILITNIIWFSCSLLGGLFVLLWGLIGKKIILKENIFLINDNELLIRVVFMSLLWALGELILSQTSFFWIGIGESLIPGDLYLAGLARFIGSKGISFIALLIGFWLYFIFEKWKRRLNISRLLLGGILIIAFLHLIGAYLIKPTNRDFEFPIAIWQTNIPTREKLFLNNQITTDKILTQQEKALSQNAKLLVAPEGTLYSDFVFQKPNKIDMLIGGFRKENNTIRNSLMSFKKGEKLYSDFIDKYRLVPLGEQVPNIFNRLIVNLSSLGGIESGNNKRYLKGGNDQAIVGVICYEITDGAKIRQAIQNGSKFILSIANLDPYPLNLFDQYISIASMRSIENNIDIVIASNTGPSGLIRKDGRVNQLFATQVEKNQVVYVDYLNKKTFYNRFGDKPLIITFLIILIYINFSKVVN